MSNLRLVRKEPEILYKRSLKVPMSKLEELQPEVSEDDFADIHSCEKCSMVLPEYRLTFLPDGSKICATCLYSDRREGGQERQ